ncbi:MAG: replication initiator protein [Arizlama microvirus]|nr:MAG: replication initiator protein [Arizlama microvirus]
MACYYPLIAYLSGHQTNNKTGKSFRRVSFKETDEHDRQVSLPCGQCIGCRLERSRQWAMRCMHEAQLHENNCFITLTYNDENYPNNGSLIKSDFQKFLKKFRKAIAPARIRYYMAGEYGTNFGRPHFHACIFGYDFHDKKLHQRTASGSFIYRSQELEKLWTHGYSSIGDVTFESAAYVARYIMQKQTGKVDTNHYTFCDLTTGELVKLLPEYNNMSLKPGIGAEWYKKYKNDVYPHDYVELRGKKLKPPKFYDKLYAKENPYEYDQILYTREKQAKINPEEHSYERLLVKETVQKAKLQKLKRKLT